MAVGGSFSLAASQHLWPPLHQQQQQQQQQQHQMQGQGGVGAQEAQDSGDMYCRDVVPLAPLDFQRIKAALHDGATVRNGGAKP